MWYSTHLKAKVAPKLGRVDQTFHLFTQFYADPAKRAQLDWETRHKIIQGIARGLLYLHEDSQLRVVHRDITTSNILLDAEMNPKISNFSKASRVHVDKPKGDTSKIKGKQ